MAIWVPGALVVKWLSPHYGAI